ncbi:MAG: beta strand repeat-containing protein [Rhodopila sp.]
MALTAVNYGGVDGAIVIHELPGSPIPPVIAAVPNGTQGGNVTITVGGPSGRFDQEAGGINGGNVMIITDQSTGSIDLFGNDNGGPPSGRIIATQGSIALTAATITMGSGETIAAVNNATDVIMNGALTESLNSLVQATRDVIINGEITEGGGTVVAARNFYATSLLHGDGTISAGGTLTIGTGYGVAGWGGSSAGGGSFEQNGGVLAGGAAVNIFTTGAFSQIGGVLVSGGTLGVTAAQGINIAGTVSASGGPSGFMLLASGGDAVISGLIGGPQSAVGGNAVQAPAGTVRTLSSATVFGVAGTVTAAMTPINGYNLICADCILPPSATPEPVPALALPSWQGPAATNHTNTIPLVLVGSSLDLSSNIFASTLSLYAKTQITQAPGIQFTVANLTGSAGATNTLPPGLTGLGWANAGAIGWTNSTGSVALSNPVNQITNLSDFVTTGDFLLQAVSLTQTGTVRAGGTAALTASGGPYVQAGGGLTAGTVSITGVDPLSSGITLSGGSIVATAGAVSLNSPNITVGPGEWITTSGGGTDIVFGGAITQQGGSSISAARNVSAAALTQNGGVITGGGVLAVGSGSGTAGVAGSTATSGSFVQNGGSVLLAARFRSSRPASSARLPARNSPAPATSASPPMAG